MDTVKLRAIIDYSDVFNIIAGGKRTLDEIDAEMKARKVGATTASRRRTWLEGTPPYLTVVNGNVDLDVESLYGDLDELKRTVIPRGYEEAQSGPDFEDLANGYEKEIKDLNQIIEEKDARITELESKIKEQGIQLAGAEMKRKVLVASSIEVGPKEGKMDDVFLVDPKDYLDLDEYVSIYGGELDSFYKDNPADPVEEPKTEEDKFKPGKELTERNYALKLMKNVGTALFFKKRVDDTKAVKEKEARVGQLFPGVDDHKTERQLERDKIIRNRCRSLNMIIECDRLTNQEKLMMYAMMTQYHNTFVERLLNWAGKHCINANYLIPILEDRSTSYNYENTIMFLEQFAEASEFKMKLDLARELIEGKWYIVADYNGKKTKFQLVP